MAKLTRNGIAHDLTISPYKQIISYDNGELIYVFSSELHLTKFESRMKHNRKKINSSLSHRFGYLVKHDILADLKLYGDIETRGFLIYTEGGKVTCREDLRLDGVKVTKKD